MDTYSLAGGAQLLGVTAPRVRRAVDRLGLRVAREASGAFRLTRRQLAELADDLGTTPPAGGLSRIETQVLAALSRSPNGLTSLRAVARRAGVSPTATGRAVGALVECGLVTRSEVMIARGRAEGAVLLRANLGSPDWTRLGPELGRVRLPKPARGRPYRRVPPSLRHLFWNTAAAQLEVATSSDYIARRLLTSGDPDGLAWGVAGLPAHAWEHAARSRGIDARTRALALNLARYADASS